MSVIDSVKEVGIIAKALSSPGFWKRAGVISLGLFLVVLGIAVYLSSNKTVREVAIGAATKGVL